MPAPAQTYAFLQAFTGGRRPPGTPRPSGPSDLTPTSGHLKKSQSYGAPRIHRELQAQGVAAGRHRIARLMRREGIVACTERRFRWTATARAELPAAPDRLRRDFTAPAPNQRWVSDITSVRTGQGWLHLAIVLDSTPAASCAGPWRRSSTSTWRPTRSPWRSPTAGPWAAGPLRSRRSVPRHAGPAATGRPSSHRQHQSAKPLPRQRRGREFLSHAQYRAGRPAPLSHARGGPPGGSAAT